MKIMRNAYIYVDFFERFVLYEKEVRRQMQRRSDLIQNTKFLDFDDFCIAYTKYLLDEWHYPDKIPIPNLFIPKVRSADLLENRLQAFTPFQGKRRTDVRKIAHIIGRYRRDFSVSRRLRDIVSNYGDTVEEVHLFTTELPYYCSSGEVKCSEGLEELKVHIHQASGTLDIASQASQIARNIVEYEIDTVIFHDFSVSHALIGKMLQGPRRIFMEHGHFPSCQGCFDAVILTHSREEEVYASLAQKLQLTLKSNPNCLSLKVPLRSKKRWGFPQEAFLMTTVSNNLTGRLTEEMLNAVAQILQRCPQAFYLPIGPIPSLESFYALFKEYRVEDKVLFLGRLENPLAALVNMDLYLNEFPCGSGLSLLEAMAVGCPIVTMDYPYGSIQGRHGANYFSLEKSVSPPSISSYIDLACTLIENREKHREWSQWALKKYQERSNMKPYMERHMVICNSL